MTHLRSYLRESRVLRDGAFLLQNTVSSFRTRQVAPIVRSQRNHLGAVVRVKDEARFLPEWVAYHRTIGFERFYIYNNDSSDGLHDVLRPYVDREVVRIIDWPLRPISPSADLHFLKEFSGEFEWVAFFDADEFVYESRDGLLLDALRNTNAPALALNWRYFGSSHHENIPMGLVTKNFILGDDSLDRHIKVIARTAEIQRYRTPHNFYYRGGRLARTPDGRRALASFSEVAPRTPSDLVLNHYVYRSREDYARKVRRGYATGHGEADRARRESRIESEFLRHNQSTYPVHLERIDAVERELSELGYGAPFA